MNLVNPLTKQVLNWSDQSREAALAKRKGMSTGGKIAAGIGAATAGVGALAGGVLAARRGKLGRAMQLLSAKGLSHLSERAMLVGRAKTAQTAARVKRTTDFPVKMANFDEAQKSVAGRFLTKGAKPLDPNRLKGKKP